MATRILMRHKETGLVKHGFYGYSWTTFFFGFIPALFRSDFLTFAVGFGLSMLIGLFGYSAAGAPVAITWAFFYNKYYTRKLIEKGYEFAGSEDENRLAASALGVAPAQPVPEELMLQPAQA